MIGISKNELRKIAKKKRSQINKPDAGQRLCDNFLKNIRLKPNNVIASYHPTQSEIDVMPLNLKLIDLGYRLCLPVTDGDILKFYEWNGKAELALGKYGIKTPKSNTQNLIPNYVIVPMLAFDSSKNRLGYGGGYYDRALSNLSAIKIGVAFEEQEFPEIHSEITDVKLDYIVTDGKIF